jgi:hypothetical protein
MYSIFMYRKFLFLYIAIIRTEQKHHNCASYKPLDSTVIVPSQPLILAKQGASCSYTVKWTASSEYEILMEGSWEYEVLMDGLAGF